MNRSILCYGLWLLLTVSPALGNPLINIDTQYLLFDSNVERRIPILVTTDLGERIEGVELAVQIGDGGELNGGSTIAPKITNLDVIGAGTIFNASNTSSTPLYLSESGLPPSLIALADTSTPSGDVEASGVLGYLTLNPQGAAIGQYQLHLVNVGENVEGGPWNTNFGSISADFSSSYFSINVVNLHEMKWNAGTDGSWTDTTWTNLQTPYPNYTAQAVVDSPYQVSVDGAQEADSLKIKFGGQVAIYSTGSLTVTNAVTLPAGGTLSLDSGGVLSADEIQLEGGTITGGGTLISPVTVSNGVLSAPSSGDNLVLSAGLSGTGNLNKTGSGTVTLLDEVSFTGNINMSDGRLQVNALNASLHSVSGYGTLGVGDDLTPSVLTIDSVNINTLTIGAGSKLVLAPRSGGPLAGSVSLSSVPEPSTITLLIAAALGTLLYCKRFQKRR